MESKVYITGAGCGNKDYLTLKAYETIKSADVVVYDQLISQDIIDLIPNNAEKIFAGKVKSYHHMPQPNINQVLVNLAKSDDYKVIVRLKGGDPFIFGRGAEEAEYLKKNNVKFEVIAGITAATGCGASSLIPMTHRDFVTGVHFVTGHGCKEKRPQINWKNLVDCNSTIVFYMGITNSDLIQDNLLKFGMDKDMPIAIVHRGGMTGQKVYITKLDQLIKTIDDNNVKSPAVIIVGQVANLHSILSDG